jgi:hypothetical protein
MQPRCDSISKIEVVQVRLFDINDGLKVVGVFHRETGFSQHPLQATLYRSPTIRNDWAICFFRADSGEDRMKSPEAVRCAELLRPIGFVDHAVWLPVTGGKSLATHHSLKRPAPDQEPSIVEAGSVGSGSKSL